ncbi:hypothetical protein N7495_004296 [Penicillium taxi]|uniref:uncharacterized protein n=1 Tax=Penicillium taxi TaxID=168475 RepID=UPI0025458FBE|nr:uncharacterized protein N7495_004296 [Penicillium taxi]KAJ5899552.1 hypothetical protein N7495_004296 [Penicillium taxi]
MNVPEAGGGHAARRAHTTHLSISDPNHHVTEAIGHMYNDDYDRNERNDARRLSYISSPLGESITTIPRTAAGSESPPPTSLQYSPTSGQTKQTNGGHLRPPLAGQRSFERDSDYGSDLTGLPSETATASFPLNDIDYESDPAAVVQELNNLAAIRRMSMDVAAAGDPDLPSFGSDFSIPSLPPSPSTDENDTSRLFWVPASLHPELAPMEFKSFLESKADVIKRKSVDFSSLGPERQGSGSGLHRKKSMLSKQIDISTGYTDGAERLERKRSQSTRRDRILSPNLQQLETLVDDSNTNNKDLLIKGIQSISVSGAEDKPILPPAPPGLGTLRRATRTQYRKNTTLKKGEKPLYSKRVGRGLSESAGSAPKTDEQLSRMSSDTAPVTRTSRSPSSSSHGAAHSPTPPASSTTFDPIHRREAEPERAITSPTPDTASDSSTENNSTHGHQWHSRISTNGRSTVNTPQSNQTVPSIVETPPEESNRPTSSPSPTSRAPERDVPSAHSAKPKPPMDTTPSKRSLMNPNPGRDTTPSINDLASSTQMIPGQNTRTDSLSFIPTLPEDRKSEDRKSEAKKSKKEDGSRKSSWHWLLGSEKDKDHDTKKSKSKYADKSHHQARPDTPQSSAENTSKGRESLALDRLDPRLEEERRKDGVRRASGDNKKEKDGIFSSIFGGSKKKHGLESHHHRKSLSRNLSPDPPIRQLRADLDYPWTRFSILEERAIYRMAHIKLANPRRALFSQVLLSNFMYSYLEKVQQMHPQGQIAVTSSGSQRQQSKAQNQPDEYTQYQRYQESQQQQQYSDSAYDDPSMYDYEDESHDRYQAERNQQAGYQNGHGSYDMGQYQYGHSTFGDDVQLDDDDDDDMW